jgi:molybdopterin synthase catalytic subunit
MIRAQIVTSTIDPARLITEVSSLKHGAVSLFIGTVRETSGGRQVSGIEYSAYAEMALSELERIVDEARDRFGIAALAVEHRVGKLALGDVSVGIAVAHEHRGQALDATRFVIEEIKKSVPIWKSEHYSDGTRQWVDPTRGVSEVRS